MFDFDNTLVDFHESSRLAFDQCFIDYELEQKSDYYKIYNAINAKIWKNFEDKKITAVDIREQRFTLFLKEIGLVHLDGLAFNARYLDNLIKFTTVRPEVKEMLVKLKSNYKLSIITNGLKEVQRPRIEKCGLTKLFDSIIVSDEIGVAKPDVAFFDFALNTLDQSIDKSKVLVIGDSIHSDIKGANASGLKSCFIKSNKDQAVKADIVIDDVLELPSILDDIYVPVDCGWYDYLEIYAMRKNKVEIHYVESNTHNKIITQILDLQTKNKEEFVILSDGKRIRLDKVKQINLVD